MRTARRLRRRVRLHAYSAVACEETFTRGAPAELSGRSLRHAGASHQEGNTCTLSSPQRPHPLLLPRGRDLAFPIAFRLASSAIAPGSSEHSSLRTSRCTSSMGVLLPCAMACELKVRAAMAYKLGADCDGGSYELLWAPWLMSSGADDDGGDCELLWATPLSICYWENLTGAASIKRHLPCYNWCSRKLPQAPQKASTGDAKCWDRSVPSQKATTGVAKSFDRHRKKLQPRRHMSGLATVNTKKSCNRCHFCYYRRRCLLHTSRLSCDVRRRRRSTSCMFLLERRLCVLQPAMAELPPVNFFATTMYGLVMTSVGSCNS